MPSKRKNKRKKGSPSGESVSAAAAAVSGPTRPPAPTLEMAPAKMPPGFNVDDFLFSKLYKSVNMEGKRTINQVLEVIFQQMVEDVSSYTVERLVTESGVSRNKMSNIKSKLDVNVLQERLDTVTFDVTCGIHLLRNLCYDYYKRLSSPCQAQIWTLRELRNSLSHNYPLVHRESEPYEEKLSSLLKTNEELDFLLNEIKELEEKKSGMDAGKELDGIQECIDEKKKEKFVIIEIEKIRIILNDILENVGAVFEKDLTWCKSKVNKNLSHISRAKVRQYDHNAYEEEVKRFKKDPIHELITKARQELKQQYKNLRVANPCPWILRDQAEKSSVVNFYIDKIYTPLRIEGPKTEIVTEDLLTASKNIGKKTVVPNAVVVSGLAGSGKTSLCLYLLHHWAQDTREIKALNDYNLVIFLEMRTIRSNFLVEYLKTQRMKKSTSGILPGDLVQRLDDLKLLFIVDGYDEAKRSSQKLVEDIFAKFSDQRFLITTRGEFCNEVKRAATKHHVDYLTVEICGFDSTRIEEFTDKVFRAINRSSYYVHSQTSSTRDSAEFLAYVHQRAKILEKLLELPLTLALMIYLWKDCPETLNRVTTCTSLYYELFCLFQKKLKDRLKDPCPDAAVERLLLLIGEKAWQMVVNEETVMPKEDEGEIGEQCEVKGVPKEELMSAFLIYEPDDNAAEYTYNYSFMHKTQMEYLSAYFIAEAEPETRGWALEFFHGCGLHQVLLFLVGHFARKKTIEQNLWKILELIDKVDIKSDDFNFWCKLLTESVNNKRFLRKICQTKLPRENWKLTHNNVVSGLELLMASPTSIKELTIDIENGTDPYDVKDLLSTMRTMRPRLKNQYNKCNPILTELSFWHHFQGKCTKPSDSLVRTLYPWGHLQHFTGSLGEQPKNQEILNYCFKAKNLRIRVDTCAAQVSLANSLRRISGSVRHLRVMTALDPKECDADSLVCLNSDNFMGHLELTIPNMKDEDKKWIVRAVEKLCGEPGCSRLALEKSFLSFNTVLYIMMQLKDVVQEKLTVETIHDLTGQQWVELDKQILSTRMECNWIPC